MQQFQKRKKKEKKKGKKKKRFSLLFTHLLIKNLLFKYSMEPLMSLNISYTSNSKTQ